MTADEYKSAVKTLKRELARVEKDHRFFQMNYPSHTEAMKLFTKRLAELRGDLAKLITGDHAR